MIFEHAASGHLRCQGSMLLFILSVTPLTEVHLDLSKVEEKIGKPISRYAVTKFGSRFYAK
jgi:hypothetical protein